eukprot:TRINITY_DN8260_c0_g1_i1.p1 TRINITY_DN8260_c0_g1~~TRINITY_DN8260_c0_g1_i1.p1  ORF type:complete len:672 (-),score=81.74 TRINITY_DN8260_c0_g1_i1:4-2019(-)
MDYQSIDGAGNRRSRRRLYDEQEELILEDNSNDVLEKKKEKLNRLFGVRPWSFKISRQEYIDPPDDYEKPPSKERGIVRPNTVLWVIFFGWWMSLFYILASVLLFISFVGIPYAKLCWRLKSYIFWPFGKYLVERIASVEEDTTLRTLPQSSFPRIPYLIWTIVFSIVIVPMSLISLALTWFFVVSIPMAKMNWKLLKILTFKPSTLEIKSMHDEEGSVLFCTYQAFNKNYLHYSVWGMNIVFFNLFPVVVIRTLIILIGVIMHVTSSDTHQTSMLNPVFQFFLDIVCSIPITFYIGQSISSIAAQTSYVIGAILNATFGSVTELTLYTLALNQGGLDDLILYSVTGGLLSDMLLLPGLSMICGGIKYKEQFFNPVAAGVSSLLLFVAVVGSFAPTVFYHTFGTFTQICHSCNITDLPSSNYSGFQCLECSTNIDLMRSDPKFLEAARYLIYFCSTLLPLAYLMGLLFTLKTHSHLFTQEEDGEEHGTPEWSLTHSVLLMLASVLMFGLLAEDIVSVVEDVLQTFGISTAFLGLTLIALTPAATELASAIKFALRNQIALSVEIGSASAVQISLIQMPVITGIASIFAASRGESPTFGLIFPLLSVFCVSFAVITFNYISADGKTNYFVGTALVLIYVILIASFWFIPDKVKDSDHDDHLSQAYYYYTKVG